MILEWLHFRGEWSVRHKPAIAAISPRDHGVQKRHQNHEKSKVTIELKRRNSPSSVILRMSLALHRVIPSALLVHRTPMSDQVGVERKPHLNEPHSLENQPYSAGEFGKVRIFGGF